MNSPVFKAATRLSFKFALPPLINLQYISSPKLQTRRGASRADTSYHEQPTGLPTCLPPITTDNTAAMSFESVMPPYNASDPNASFLSSSCLDFLLIELVPMAYRVTNELEAASDAATAAAALPHGSAASAPAPSAPAAPSVSSTALGGTGTADSRKMDEDEERDAVFFRLESLGYRVGQGLVER